MSDVDNLGVLPSRLTISSVESFLSTATEVSVLDWRHVEWLELPCLVELLVWSAHQVEHGRAVAWQFGRLPVPQALTDLSGEVRHHLGGDRYGRASRSLVSLRRRASTGRITRAQRRQELAALRATIAVGPQKRTIERWLDSHEAQFPGLDVAAYIARYAGFSRASECGIVLTPSEAEIAVSKIVRADASPCLELVPIHSTHQVDRTLVTLHGEAELERIVGSYANLDVVRRGVLVDIVVRELGANVLEHSESSSAWLCTRVVDETDLRKQSPDVVNNVFLKRGVGFLEIIVADHGVGLGTSLEETLRGDQRLSITKRYTKDRNGSYKHIDLVDYAFDRLSSRKRDISQLMHIQKEEDGGVSRIASGLYWIWNVVRSYEGVLSIRTKDVSLTYDFGGRKPRRSDVESLSNFPGTMFRICFPLQRQKAAAAVSSVPSRREIRRVRDTRLHLVWAGDLDVKTSVQPTRRKDLGQGRTTQPALFAPTTKHDSLLEVLASRHARLADGDSLVLDLSGTVGWTKDLSAPFVRFFLEMNFTAPAGRSAVVLWNVPAHSRAVFEESVEMALAERAHLKDLRRVACMYFDDGTVRLFSGWPELENIISPLVDNDDLSLSELRIETLAPDVRDRCIRILKENSHAFDWETPERVRLRPSKYSLLREAWKEATAWFVDCLAKAPQDGGIRTTRQKGWYRLPWSDTLVRSFYQFGILTADERSCTRLAWMIASVARALPRNGGGVLTVIGVASPAVRILEAIRDGHYLDDRLFRIVTSYTIDELPNDPDDPIRGDAVVVTDVIRSGTLCAKVAEVLPQVSWCGTIAGVDIRDLPDDDPIAFDNGAECHVGPAIATGQVYALARRRAQVDPGDPTTEDVVSIDPINVAPVELADSYPVSEHDIWEFLERRPAAMHVGHQSSGEYHHYLYYVAMKHLLEAPSATGGHCLRDLLIDSVIDSVSKDGFDPSETVIIHPPGDASDGAGLAVELQRSTGIRRRYALYRGKVAGQWRFATFVQHPLPQGQTVVIVDDGANSGETLMGMLQAAASSHPKRVLAWLGISRMAPHLSALVHHVRTIEGVGRPVAVRSAVGLAIPVYSPDSCPLCRLQATLVTVAERCPILARHANEARRLLSPSPAGTSRSSLWRCSSPIGAAQLREALETCDFSRRGATFVAKVVESAVRPSKVANKSLLDLAYVVCTEPDLISGSALRGHAYSLFESAVANIRLCHDHDRLTVALFAFYSAVQAGASGTAIEDAAASLWNTLASTGRLDGPLLGKLLSFAVAFVVAQSKAPRGRTSATFAMGVIEASPGGIKASSEESPSMASLKGLAKLYRREAVNAIRRPNQPREHGWDAEATEELYELALATASRTWWHAASHMDAAVDRLAQVQGRTEGDRAPLFGPVNVLVETLNQIHSLRQRLKGLEDEEGQVLHELSGVMRCWASPELNEALVGFGHQVSAAVDRVDEGSLPEVPSLKESWKRLQVVLNEAFNDIFPEVSSAVDRHWGNFAHHTQLPQGLAMPFITRAAGRGFVPLSLLARFLDVAMKNLRTAAFCDTSAQALARSWATIEVVAGGSGSGQWFVIRLTDNGAGLEAESEGGHHRGLADIRTMVTRFGGTLIGPRTEAGRTMVELKVRRRAAPENEGTGQAN